MSVSVPLLYPLSLKQIDLMTNTCIGSPFISSKSCSQQLKRSPNGKSLASTKDELGRILHSVDQGIIPFTDQNFRTLKKIAKSLTCDGHKALSKEFAYHWLASSRLARFLKHMSWNADAIKWKCLAAEDSTCTSILDCFKSADLHDEVRGLLNRISLGWDRYRSLSKLARHWFCKKHQRNTGALKKTLENLRPQCEYYWSSIGVHKKKTKRNDPEANDKTPDQKDDSSYDNSTIEDSMISSVSDTIDSLDNTTLNQTSEVPSISISNATIDAGQIPDDPLPWNDPGLHEYDGEDESQADPYPSILSNPSSPTAPTASPSSAMQVNPEPRLSYQMPCTFDSDPISITQKESVRTPCSSPITRRLSAPNMSQPSSTKSKIPQKPCPVFTRCEAVSNKTVFNDTFKCIKEPEFHAGDANYGYIYVHQVVESPSHVKVGRTVQTIQDRQKQISRCAGQLAQVEEEGNVCKVPQHRLLETIILKSLRSRQCSFVCLRCKGNDYDKGVGHHEWFEIYAKEEAIEFAHHVERFRRWWSSEPYDDKGHLFPRWQMRIDFFECSKQRYRYLHETSSPFKAWSTFLDPPWWIRVHMTVYEVFFYPRGNLSCRWTIIRENWIEIVYDAAFGSAAFIVLLMYSGYNDWVLNPATLPLIFLGVLCRVIWQR